MIYYTIDGQKIVCRVCLNEGIENEALGKKFHYCRNCKEEIVDEEHFDLNAYYSIDGFYDFE